MSNTNTTNRREPRLHFNFQDLMSKSKRTANGCIEWQLGVDKNGYAQINVNKKRVYVHRYVATLMHGPSNGRFALHSCDNPPCINPDHLRWGTAKENAEDRVERNPNAMKSIRGNNHPNAKLSEADVIHMRSLINEGMTYAQAGRWFGVTKINAANIAKGKIWKHLL